MDVELLITWGIDAAHGFSGFDSSGDHCLPFPNVSLCSTGSLYDGDERYSQTFTVPGMMSPTMLVSRAPDPAPHLHGYSPQQTQQLDALANAHRAAQQQQPHSSQPLYATRRSATTPSASANQACAPPLPSASSLAPNEQRLVSLIA